MIFKNRSAKQLLTLFGASILIHLLCNIAVAGAYGDKYGRAFVWANQASATIGEEYVPMLDYAMVEGWENLSGTPDNRYEYNTDVGITRTSTGNYTVVFYGLQVPMGVPQITPHGGSHYCKVVSYYPSGKNTIVKVRCFNYLGTARNGRFNLMYYYSASLDEKVKSGYAIAHNASAAIGSPYNAIIASTSSGQPITIERQSKGKYEVVFNDIDFNDNGFIKQLPFAMVTAYGPDNYNCEMSGLGMLYDDNEEIQDTRVWVKCFDANNNPQDSIFMVSLLTAPYFGMFGGEYGTDNVKAQAGYVFVDWRTGDVNNESTHIAAHIGTGRYNVYLPNIKAANKSIPMVEAMSGHNCTVYSWGQSQTFPSASELNVRCYDRNGTLADTSFSFGYFTNEK